MSGDVQPRKRKDKRRRRDDDEGSATAQSVPLVRTGSTDHSDNVTIHVYKEAGTGGHWCARIVFFALLAGLLGVVGLIILEHRGTSDVDTPVTASQWAMIFEGWVDEAPHEEHEESREEDEGHGSEHQDEDEEEEEEVEEPGPDKTISEEETDEGLGDDLDDDEANADADETEDDYASPEKDDEDEDRVGSEDADEDEGYSKEESDDEADDDLGAFEEVEDDDVNDDDDDAEDENVADAAFDSDLDFSIEGIRAAADEDHEFQSFIENADNAEEYISIPGVNEIDDNSAEPLEEIDGEDPEEIVNEVNNEEEDEEEEKAEQMLEEESTSVAMKFGVGIALIVTAHFVLVRRWNNGDADALEILTNSDEVPNLSRRNTLVPPGRIKEVDLKNSDKKTSLNKEKEQTYEDLRSTYKTVESLDKKKTDVENIFSKKTADLQAILFGESKDSKTNLSVENTERQTEEDEYSEGENDFVDDEEYDEEDMEEDYEDEGEEEEEEEEDVEDVDDTELVEKLDKKYGKLPTPPYSDQDDEEEEEEEEDEEEEEEVDEDEEEDDELDGWKRVKAPTPGDQVMENSKKSESKPKSGGQQGGNYIDDSLEDLRITEETDSISSQVPGF